VILVGHIRVKAHCIPALKAERVVERVGEGMTSLKGVLVLFQDLPIKKQTDHFKG
jgi:hypothetical protein